MLLVIGSFTLDHYLIVAYIQTKLIPIVANEVKQTNIWGWEKFLYRRRGNSALAWELPPAAVAFACPVIVLAWHHFGGWG